MRAAIAVGVVCLMVLPIAGQESAWKKLQFVMGTWTGIAGEKDTPQGAGAGDFSFEAQLEGKIVVRHNRAAYDAGARHEDLMVIYLDAPDDTPRAMYFDSEGHVIRYNVSFPGTGRVTFESDGTQAGPRYRLSYWMEGSALHGKFEVAPPGAEYAAYLSWTSRKN